jgi:hypothetical protein
MRFVSSSNGIALNHDWRTVVTRYRIALEQKHYAPSAINLELTAVRRLAYEASDSGLLSPDLAAGIQRVKGIRRLGVRLSQCFDECVDISTIDQLASWVPGWRPLANRQTRSGILTAIAT